MRALNATVIPSNQFTALLSDRRAYPNWRTHDTKRADRRRQRHALKAELSSLVDLNLEAEMQVLQDHVEDVSTMRSIEMAVEKYGDEALPFLRDHYRRPEASHVVTVIRKRAHQRRVVEQVLLAA